MLPVIYKQIYAVTDVVCLFYAIGFNSGMVSVMIPSLRRPESDIHVTADEESWIASLPYLLMFPAQCAGAFAAERLGRRPVVSVALLPPAISFIIMHCARAPSTLLTAVTAFGLVGAGTGIGTVLVAETSSPKYRGVLLSAKPLAVVLGLFTVHLLEKFFDWRHVVLVGVAPCLLGLVTSLSSPESPAWLAARGRFRECERAFQWLRGAEDAAELRALVSSQRAAREKALQATSGAMRRTAHYLTDKCFIKATLISLACVLVMEASGIFLMYLLDIIIMVTGDKENAHYIAVGLDLLNIFGCAISCWLAKFVNRRSLLFSGAVPAICFMLLFCLTSFLISQSIIPNIYKWLQLSFLLLFFLTSDISFPVIHNIVGEIFPLSHRGLGVAYVGLAFSCLSFVGTKILPTLISTLGVHGAFVVIDTVLVLNLTYLYFCLPETGDKTLEDVECEMRNKEKSIK